MGENPIIGICDRCGKDIPKKQETSVTAIREIHYRMGKEAFQLHFLICEDCKRSFDDWIFKKGTDPPA